MSSFMRLSISAGVPARISMPSAFDLSWMVGSGSTSLRPFTSVSITGFGVAAGTDSPFQLSTSKSSMPASSAVGTSGR